MDFYLTNSPNYHSLLSDYLAFFLNNDYFNLSNYSFTDEGTTLDINNEEINIGKIFPQKSGVTSLDTDDTYLVVIFGSLIALACIARMISYKHIRDIQNSVLNSKIT